MTDLVGFKMVKSNRKYLPLAGGFWVGTARIIGTINEAIADSPIAQFTFVTL
jgi:hypothetical protein